MLNLFPLKLVSGKLCMLFSVKKSLMKVMKVPWQPLLASPFKANALQVVLIKRRTPDSVLFWKLLLKIGSSSLKWVRSTSSKPLFAVSAIWTSEWSPQKKLFSLDEDLHKWYMAFVQEANDYYEKRIIRIQKSGLI